MQPRHLVTLSGTVLSLRRVDIDPREATETAKAFAGTTYEEATIATPLCELDGQELPGLSAYVTVRFDSASPILGELVPTAEVSLLCSTFVEVYKIRGRWANSVGYRYARLALPIKTTASRPTMAHAS